MKRIRRSPYQTMAAILVMTVTMFLACAFFVVAVGSQAVLKYFESRPQLNIFFKSDYVPTQSQIDLMQAKLVGTGLVETVKFVSKEEALNIYKELNKRDPLLLEAVTSGMLPASIEVSAKNPNDLKLLSEVVKDETGIDEIRYEEDVVAELTRWTNSVRIIGGVFVGIQVLIAFVVIFIIIGIRVAGRKDEINVMQLIGAKSSYIASPFIWEGFWYGVTGAVLAWGIVYLVILYSMGFLISFLGNIPILPPPVLFMFEVLGGSVLIGGFIGGLSGLMAVGRFLKS
ncbi:MAG: ABC transporter permease [Patescibacteria group bacterium]